MIRSHLPQAASLDLHSVSTLRDRESDQSLNPDRYLESRHTSGTVCEQGVFIKLVSVISDHKCKGPHSLRRFHRHDLRSVNRRM